MNGSRGRYTAPISASGRIRKSPPRNPAIGNFKRKPLTENDIFSSDPSHYGKAGTTSLAKSAMVRMRKENILVTLYHLAQKLKDNAADEIWYPCLDALEQMREIIFQMCYGDAMSRTRNKIPRVYLRTLLTLETMANEPSHSENHHEKKLKFMVLKEIRENRRDIENFRYCDIDCTLNGTDLNEELLDLQNDSKQETRYEVMNTESEGPAQFTRTKDYYKGYYDDSNGLDNLHTHDAPKSTFSTTAEILSRTGRPLLLTDSSSESMDPNQKAAAQVDDNRMFTVQGSLNSLETSPVLSSRSSSKIGYESIRDSADSEDSAFGEVKASSLAGRDASRLSSSEVDNFADSPVLRGRPPVFDDLSQSTTESLETKSRSLTQYPPGDTKLTLPEHAIPNRYGRYDESVPDSRSIRDSSKSADSAYDRAEKERLKRIDEVYSGRSGGLDPADSPKLDVNMGYEVYQDRNLTGSTPDLEDLNPIGLNRGSFSVFKSRPEEVVTTMLLQDL